MRRKRRVGVPIELHAESIYTRRMYDKFYNELYCSGGYAIKRMEPGGLFEVAHSCMDGNPEQLRYKVRYGGGDKVHCECGLYEHMGMLCRHALKVWTRSTGSPGFYRVLLLFFLVKAFLFMFTV